jgi:hypothetical protein
LSAATGWFHRRLGAWPTFQPRGFSHNDKLKCASRAGAMSSRNVFEAILAVAVSSTPGLKVAIMRPFQERVETRYFRKRIS